MAPTDFLKRTTIIVGNAEKAADFYGEVFGMSRWMDVPFTLSGNQLAAGKKGDKTRLIILKANDDQIGMIGLLEWLDPLWELPQKKPRAIKFGAPIFVFSVNDCNKSIDIARSLGADIYCEPHEWQVVGADGVKRSLMGASFFDPEGYFFEINQTL